MNRALKTLAAARLDWWEAGYYVDSSRERERRHAKRTAKRARRRLDKALVAEALAGMGE